MISQSQVHSRLNQKLSGSELLISAYKCCIVLLMNIYKIAEFAKLVTVSVKKRFSDGIGKVNLNRHPVPLAIGDFTPKSN